MTMIPDSPTNQGTWALVYDILGVDMIDGEEQAVVKRPLIDPRLYYRLLNVHQGSLQGPNGAYTTRLPVSQDLVRRHLDGEICLALMVVVDGKAAFLGLDIDNHFPKILPSVSKVLRHWGFEKASFATTGSDSQRGKVVVTFDSAIDQLVARAVGDELVARVRATATDVTFADGDIESRPRLGEGGLLRVLGRNIKRQGPLEVVLSLDGTAGDLAKVAPLSPRWVWNRFRFITSSKASERAPMAKWCLNRLSQPWDWPARGNAEIFRRVLAIAREIIRVNPDTAEHEFYQTCELIKQNSPLLHKPSPKTKDPRHPLRREVLTNAWRLAQERPTSYLPIDTSDMPPEIQTLYATLYNYLLARGVPPINFQIDYDRLGRLLSFSKPTAWRRVRAAAKCGALSIVNPGCKRERGKKGRMATLSLKVNRR